MATRVTRTPRQRKKATALVKRQLTRHQSGRPVSTQRMSPTARQHFVLVERLNGVKAVKEVKSVRDMPANRLLGPQFRQRNIVSSLDFVMPNGGKARVRLLTPSDSKGLYEFYYQSLSQDSRTNFASRPIFQPGHNNPKEMKERLERMSVGEFPKGKALRDINTGKRPDIFKPAFPVVKEVRKKIGAQEKIVQRQILFDPSLNYIIEGPNGKVIGFFQLKYLATKPNFGVAIADSYHGQGLGRLGVRMAIDAAQRLGLPRVELTVKPGNQAERLYSREGFKTVGHAKVWAGTPQERTEDVMEIRLK